MIKKKDNRFLYHRTELIYDTQTYKKIIVMDNHEYYLFKNPHYIAKWWIIDSETGVYVCRGEYIDEAYDNLNKKRDTLQGIFKTERYQRMRETYKTLKDEWEASGRCFKQTESNYSLEQDYRDE